jgi:hypothetical protein
MDSRKERKENKACMNRCEHEACSCDINDKKCILQIEECFDECRKGK